MENLLIIKNNYKQFEIELYRMFFKKIFFYENINKINISEINCIVLNFDILNINLSKLIRIRNKKVPIVFIADKKYLETLSLIKLLEIKVDLITEIDYINKLLLYFNRINKKNNIYLIDDSIYLDSSKKCIVKNNIIYHINCIELKLLIFLLKNNQKVMKKDIIKKMVWKNKVNESTYRNTIKGLRKKIGKNMLITIPKIGIKLVVRNIEYK